MSTLQESRPHETLTVDDEITHAKTWVAPVVALLALVLGLAVGVVLGKSSVDEATSQPIAAVTQVLDDLAVAVNSGDAAAIASFYTDGAVVEERTTDPAIVTEGAAAIGDHMQGYVAAGFAVHPTGSVMQHGDFVVEESTWSGGGGFTVYQFDGDLKIVHQWVMGTS